MDKTYTVNFFGESMKVMLSKKKYGNGNLAICVDYFDEDLQNWLPDGKLTVNLGPVEAGYAYVDTENRPWAESLIEKNGLGYDTGKIRISGFSCFPLYKFNEEMIDS